LNYNPQFSAIVTTYNRVKYLTSTLESIINQTYTDFEVLVIDDGSTDNTEDVMASYINDRIRYIKTSNWGGPAHPRNIGIKESKGKYLAFCDDDDIWELNKLELIYSIIQETGAKFIFSNICYIDENSLDLPGTFNIRVPNYIKKKSDLLVLNNFITLSSVVLSRRILAKSTFLEDKNFIAAEDRILWHELNVQCSFYYCQVPLVKYRKHLGSISVNRDEKLHLNIKVIKYIQEMYGYDLQIITMSKLITQIKYQIYNKKYLQIILSGLKLLGMAFRHNKLSVLFNTFYNILK
jgi:glycosyltransferase involved in cell wall biosynthesis